jgi:hypothetical protein
MIQEVPDDFLLSDFGSSVTAGAVVGLGFKDEISNFVLDDRVISIDCTLTVRTDLFGGLQYRDLVEHGGQTYRLLHEPLRQADGRFCVMLLEKVEAVFTVYLEGVFEAGVFV